MYTNAGQQFMDRFRNEMVNKARNFVSQNNLNYYLNGVIVNSTDEALKLDYYYTNFNEIPEPYYSKVLQYCKEKGIQTLLLDFSLEDVFQKSIGMNIQQVKALIDKRNAIRRKKEEIEHDFE